MACGNLSLLSHSSPFAPLSSSSSSTSSSSPSRSSSSSAAALVAVRRRGPPTGLAARAFPRASSEGSWDAKAAGRFLESSSISDYMRFRRGDGGGAASTGELQTAVVRYKKKLPWRFLQPFLEVDLVSTIHIADKEYFETLQRELGPYDCVLYEMVASKESLENRKNQTTTKRLKASRSRGFNILGFIQRQMARVLSLDFQLDCLDYQGDNWYHADLDYETFKSLQIERGESLFTFARDMTLQSTKAMVQPAAIPDNLGPWKSKLLRASRVLPMPLLGLFIIGSVCVPLGDQVTEYPEFEALSRLDFGAAMKLFLARRLTSEFTQITAAVEEKSVIIGERNKAAAEALQKAIGSGKNRIAILYGGGHMPDLGRRLREEFDMVPSEVQWITAWSIRNRELDDHSLPFLKTLAQVSGWPLNRYQTLALFIFSSVLAIDLWFWELFFDTTVNWASWATSQISPYIH